MHRPSTIAVLAAVAAFGFSGCATTIDSTAPTTSVVGETTTTYPVPGGLAAQLTTMTQLAVTLGDEIAADGSTENDVLAEIQEIWDAAGPTVSDVDPPLFREFEHLVGLLATGVGRNRPADADKAARNLGTVTAAYLEKHPS